MWQRGQDATTEPLTRKYLISMPYTPLNPIAAPSAFAPTLEIRSFSYDDRAAILAALAQQMANSGCWLLDRKSLSLSQVEYYFELQLRSIFDLYSGLIVAGLELTRASHLDLTSLCTMCKHNPSPAELGRVVTVRLEVSFLMDVEPVYTPIPAFA